jgi:hypothetical protein
LNQKDDENNEAPVSFMNTNLQGVELNYPAIDKQAYAVYKAVKNFRSYMLHIIFIIPMTVNDVNLYVDFGGVSGLSS